MNKKLWAIFALAGIATVVVMAWATSVYSPQTGADSSERNWLFSLTSDSGTLQPNADGSYELTLNGTDESIIAFTDRPYRDSSVSSLSRAVQVWPQVFADAAPNAVLVEHNSDGASDSFVVELTKPQLIDASTLKFHAVVLAPNVISVGAKNLVNKAYATPPATFDAVSLFIDDVTTTTTNFPPMAICMSKSGSEITPPGSVLASSESTSFDNACTSAGGWVERTAGVHGTYP